MNYCSVVPERKQLHCSSTTLKYCLCVTEVSPLPKQRVLRK